jgi:hypothetical protein
MVTQSYYTLIFSENREPGSQFFRKRSLIDDPKDNILSMSTLLIIILFPNN